MTILKNEGASTLSVVNQVRQALPRIQAQLPPELKLDRTIAGWVKQSGAAIEVGHDPEEAVMLPESIVSLQVIRNSGVPRLRTTQKFSKYRRFITGAKIVEDSGLR